MHYKAITIIAAAGVASASTVLPVKRALTTGWASYGCYNDYWDRALATSVTVSGQMTAEKCVAKCDSQGFTFAGAQSGTECWCDKKINQSGTAGNKQADGDCSTPCAGSSSQKCGGGWRLSVYKKGTTSTPSTYTPPSGWTSKGCYSDSWTRTIANSVTVPGSFTMTNCINTCANAGYSVAGAENGSECYCSNAIAQSGSTISDATCSAACAGDASQKCGGGWALNVYQKSGSTTTTPPTTTPYTPPTGWTSAGCYSDSWTRTLTGASSSSNSLTADSCINTCNSQNYKYAGMEAGNECYCSNTIASSGSKQGSDAVCNTPCTGNSAHMCGGGWLLSVYQKAGSTTTTPPASGDYPGKSDGWTNEGCYIDASTRTLDGSSATGSQTVESCQATCYSQQFKYAGLEAGNECHCGNSLPASKKASDADCSSPCTGKGDEMCGGGWRLNVYSKPVAASSPATFEYVGCFVDSSNARTVRDYTANLGNKNTPDACISACSAKGYGYAAMEYGSECYCGNQLWNVQAVNDGDCNMACSGDGSKKCGAGNRISLYQDTLGWC